MPRQTTTWRFELYLKCQPKSRASKLRSFSFVVESERSMPPFDDVSDFPHGFIRRMDAGEFDGRLSEELAKLSKEQLEELSVILMERDGKRRRRNRE